MLWLARSDLVSNGSASLYVLAAIIGLVVLIPWVLMPVFMLRAAKAASLAAEAARQAQHAVSSVAQQVAATGKTLELISRQLDLLVRAKAAEAQSSSPPVITVHPVQVPAQPRGTSRAVPPNPPPQAVSARSV